MCESEQAAVGQVAWIAQSERNGSQDSLSLAQSECMSDNTSKHYNLLSCVSNVHQKARQIPP